MGYNSNEFFVDQNGWRLLSEYGERIHPVTGGSSFHYGIDYGVPDRDNPFFVPVLTPYSGIVRATGWFGTRGKTVTVAVDGTEQLILFQHLDSYDVKPGDRVEAGDSVGICGTTGRSTGIHLHFEVRNDDGSELGNSVWGDPEDFKPEVEVERADRFKSGDVIENSINFNVNIRQSPYGKRSGSVKPGEVLEVEEDPDNGIYQGGYDWYKTNEGWVAGQFFMKVEPEEELEKEEPEESEESDEREDDGLSAFERLLLKKGQFSVFERLVDWKTNKRRRY